jgi:hypothetical protein
MRNATKRMLGLGLLAAAGYAVWRAFDARTVATGATGVTWDPQPFPYPPVPRETAVTASPWLEPHEGTCPTSHPVKAKLSSGIFHVPGGVNYGRTQPDRCYATPEAAEADGLRAAKS